MTLGLHRCDIIMSYPQGDELVQNTNAYYRAAYALVYRKGSGLDGVDTLEDARLKGKTVGVVAGTPPATFIAKAGLMGKAKGYQLMVDTRIDNSAADMMADLENGVIDAAVLWGPLAAYQARRGGNPASLYSGGRAARMALETGRDAVAAALNAEPVEIILTSGGTEADNMAVLGLFRAALAHRGLQRRLGLLHLTTGDLRPGDDHRARPNRLAG